jgi:hypothetical protein
MIFRRKHITPLQPAQFVKWRFAVKWQSHHKTERSQLHQVDDFVKLWIYLTVFVSGIMAFTLFDNFETKERLTVCQ